MSSHDQRRRVQRENWDRIGPMPPLPPDWWEEYQDEIPTGITLRWRDQCRARNRTKRARKAYDREMQAARRTRARTCAKHDWRLLDWASLDTH